MHTPIELSDDVVNHTLRDGGYRQEMLRVADRFLVGNITGIEPALAETGDDQVLADIGLRLSESKRSVQKLPAGSLIGVVMAMWREGRRLKPRSVSNPTGEDCLLDKLRTLDWLFSGSDVNWILYAVDDDCPEGSAGIARSLIADGPYAAQSRVLSLSDGFPYTRRPLSGLKDLSTSVKGGAILLGCQQALDDACDIVVYTDADNSTHIGQLGSLLAPIGEGLMDVMIGDRWKNNPYSWWHASRGTEQTGSRILNHLRGLLAMKPPTHDVFSPFKAFNKTILEKILPTVERFDFCFDLDVVCSCGMQGARFGSIGHLVFDSFVETTWNHYGDSTVWFQKLDGMVSAARRFDVPHNRTIAALIAECLFDPKRVEALYQVTPPEKLMSCQRNSLGDATIFGVEDTSFFVRKALLEHMN